ncbi:hypothetical protein TNCV_3287741 [Trichonephila clavipes]|nr:hypothetical protein TNCV_3287741 [Trichonephila clavipes]
MVRNSRWANHRLHAVGTSEFRKMWGAHSVEAVPKDMNLVHVPGQGSKRATKRAEDRYLRLLAERDEPATTTQLSRNLYNATETFISTIIVPRELMQLECMPGSL